MGDTNLQTKARIGVFICDCGGRISSTLDSDTLQKHISQIEGVAFSCHEAYPCSKDGQLRMQKAVIEHSLERILVAGCTPRLVERLFRSNIKTTGLDPDYLHMVDIREQVAYVDKDKSTAWKKAATLIEMGVARLSSTTKAPPQNSTVNKKALVIGGGLSSMTVALGLADQDIPVVFLEATGILGGESHSLDDQTNQAIAQKSELVLKHPQIDILFNAGVTGVTGHPGEYKVQVLQGDQTAQYAVGAIIINNGTQLKTPGAGRWYDRLRVKSQFEFEAELKQATESGQKLALNDVVMIFCADEDQIEHCSRVCCNAGIRQAIRVKELNPEANVTILFREIYLGGIGEDYESELMRARQLGVTFFRYRREALPLIGESIELVDTLTGEPVRLAYDRVVLTMPMVPQENAKTLSALLGLPLDETGFLAEPRVRLRPGRYMQPGLYVLGSAQQPADSSEALFQAFLVAARVQRFLSQPGISIDTPVAAIDPNLCTGCGNCPAGLPHQCH